MKHVLFEDKKIFYRIEGEGKPLMLIHGFAEDGRVWNYQVDELRKENKLIIPDLPGSGLSQPLQGNPGISDYAEALKAVTDAEIKNNGSSLTLVGHSMGGYISLAFAEKYGDLVNGLGLFHSSSYADGEQKKETRNKGIAFMSKNGAEAFLKNTSPNLFAEQTKTSAPELIQQLIDLSKYFKAETLISYYETMMKRPDRANILASFKKPVLLIQGLHDNAVPLQAGLEQSHLPAICFFHILKNSSHMGMWEEKDESTKWLRTFLKNV